MSPAAASLWPRPSERSRGIAQETHSTGAPQRQWEESKRHERTNEERAARGLNPGPAGSSRRAAEERLLGSVRGQPGAGVSTSGRLDFGESHGAQGH